MIGNLSFEEHVKYFNGMYDHLKSIDRNLDDATIINTIKSKVMIEQELENTMHNLNIKNIHNTPMVKDFKIWSSKYDLQSGEESEEEKSEDEESEDEDESGEENQSEEETQSEDEDGSEEESEDEDEEEYENGYPTYDSTTNGVDPNDYTAVEEFRRNYRNSEAHNLIPNISDLPEGY